MRSVLLVAVLGIAGTFSPISAEDGLTKIPGGKAGWGGVREGGVKVFVCDKDDDGRGVRVRYHLQNGDKGKVGDPNGSKRPCEERTVTNAKNPIVWYSVEAGKHPETADVGFQLNCRNGSPYCKLKK